jgi:hypothetical protein
MIRYLFATCFAISIIALGCVTQVSDGGIADAEGAVDSSEPIGEAKSGCCCGITSTDTTYAYGQCKQECAYMSGNTLRWGRWKFKYEAQCAVCYGCGTYYEVSHECVPC